MCEYQRKNNEPIERFVIAKNAKVCYDNRITNRVYIDEKTKKVMRVRDLYPGQAVIIGNNNRKCTVFPEICIIEGGQPLFDSIEYGSKISEDIIQRLEKFFKERPHEFKLKLNQAFFTEISKYHQRLNLHQHIKMEIDSPVENDQFSYEKKQAKKTKRTQLEVKNEKAEVTYHSSTKPLKNGLYRQHNFDQIDPLQIKKLNRMSYKKLLKIFNVLSVRKKEFVNINRELQTDIDIADTLK